ncbi:dolichyl-phosphate-mannose-protein mannosyltransferase [Prauserella shujinwangii]|uniref:Dolichyl-phosphate-mannose-protein mannosyltransferase n=1 Tax=Prauserella shujinwangii TaxID=1453103 RepID=A0A2T0LYQ4_9PSEU|nr:glycosyltransferase family 39 protein [Prauserella shujinwangii]PRX49256.1 dolichyl-phosphate-mannose-protein mannosyltransferase [Prauserella shujinwangii]
MHTAGVGDRPGTSAGAPLPRFALGPVALVALVQSAVLTLLSGRYGFHRDELYFLAAGDRPAWGYVDQPPLTPLLAEAATALFGDTPGGLRVPATLAGAALVVVAALVARELGGGRTAQLLAAAATAASTFVLVIAHMVSTTTFDTLLWAVLGLLTLRLLRTGDGRWWVAIGAAAGVALANKWLVLLLLGAFAVALPLAGQARALRTGWLLAGIGVAAALATPLVVWQFAHDFPMLTVAGGISEDDGAENRILFVPMQLVYLSPVLVPVWLAGFVRLWRDPAVRWARVLPVAYLVLCAALLVLGGKPYYAIPLLVLLTAAGAEPVVRWLTAGRRAARRALATGLAVVCVVTSALVALPVLPPPALDGPVLAMNKEQGEQVGWPELARTVAAVWERVPEADRATSVIFTRNYGQAGAVERFGPAFGLPGPYSGHMSYADWGPPPDERTGWVLTVGPPPAAFTGCAVVAVHDSGLGVDNEEHGTPIALCEGTTASWSRIWPGLRHFY